MLRAVKRARTSSFSTYRVQYTSMTHTPRPVASLIVLSDTEAQIRDVLVEFCNHYNQEATQAELAAKLAEPLELRITGGWVRDKLLGLDSHDIDIAINHLTGEEFATKLHTYLESHRPELALRAIHTIKKNPEKSKHLETCTTKLFGRDIDFVNLRLETYGDELRVPVIEFGTAQEDALRRDATLNALFYNINLDTIEDFTERGLEDLNHGLLRTPLPPRQTFLDDPLRVLRLIRFACRFDFTLEAETLAAMKDDDIRHAFGHKISRERVGIEMEKILDSGHPEYGLDIINYTGLSQAIFNAGPVDLKSLNTPETVDEYQRGYDAIPRQVGLATTACGMFSKAYPLGDADPKLFWLAVILAPFGSLKVHANPKKKDNWALVVLVLLREGIKLANKDVDVVTALVSHRATHKSELQLYLDAASAGSPVSRADLGFWLREYGANARLALVYNAFADFLEALPQYDVDSTHVPSPFEDASFTHPEEANAALESVVARYRALDELITDQGLTDVHLVKPLIDGKRLIAEVKALNEAYAKVKGGPWMMGFLADILRWQLAHPDEGADECVAWVREEIPKREIK